MTGRDDVPRAGYPNGDPHEMPADLAAVQADDALLDFLGSGGMPSGASDELTRVLAAWRREVHAEPVGELVDTSTALAVIHAAARRPVHHHHPVYSSIAAAAAVLVVMFAGVGLVAKQARPGDQLWGVTRVLYSHYALSVETASKVQNELDQANIALQEKKPEKARASLQHVQQQLPVIGETEGRTDLTARHRELEQILQGSSAGGLVTMPALPPPPASPSASQRLAPTTPSTTSGPTPAGSTITPSPTTPSPVTPGPITTPPTSTSTPASRAGQPGLDAGHEPGVRRPSPPRQPPRPSVEGAPASESSGGGRDTVSGGNSYGGTSSPGATAPSYSGEPSFCDQTGPGPHYCGP
ncbi:MAG: anti-sigma-D factor RsdA [Pseudonocardiaceae bacterium]